MHKSGNLIFFNGNYINSKIATHFLKNGSFVSLMTILLSAFLMATLFFCHSSSRGPGPRSSRQPPPLQAERKGPRLSPRPRQRWPVHPPAPGPQPPGQPGQDTHVLRCQGQVWEAGRPQGDGHQGGSRIETMRMWRRPPESGQFGSSGGGGDCGK